METFNKTRMRRSPVKLLQLGLVVLFYLGIFGFFMMLLGEFFEALIKL